MKQGKFEIHSSFLFFNLNENLEIAMFKPVTKQSYFKLIWPPKYPDPET